MSLTIAPSPFGSLVVSVAETGSTLSVTTVATAPAVLTMALGVPGPTGATGATGATGPAGAAGVGVPVGGTNNQALVKSSDTNYDTTWAGPFLPLTGGTLTGALSIANAEFGPYNCEFGVDTGLVVNGSENGFTFDGNGLTLNGASQALTIPDSGLAFGFLNNTLGSGILFSDDTTQTTAFPPAGGTTADYIDGTGALQVFPEVGDRYLTTSTSTLTIDNGNGKTMTVETGLAYSPQQEITVYNSAGNYMTGTVVSYNAGTGVLVFDSDHHTGSGTFSSWTVNVGGAGGVLTFATTAEAQNTLSTNTVISPKTVHDAMYYAGSKTQFGWSVATSGAGASSGTYGIARSMTSPTTAVGYAIATVSSAQWRRGAKFSDGLDFSKRVVFGGRLSRTNTTTIDANTVFRFSIGKNIPAVAQIGDLTATAKGMMIKTQGNAGVIQFLVANGTTLDTINTTFVPVNNQCYDVTMISDGAGTATLYINDTLVATSTNAPTTVQTELYGCPFFELSNLAITTNATTYILSEMFLNQGI